MNVFGTDNDKRDADLKSEHFFDAAKYPTITFVSKSFKNLDDKNYKVTGNLTMKGITKTIELNAAYKMGTHPMTKKTIVGFKVTGMVKRSDFGIGSSMGAATVGDEVTLLANSEFAKE